jgi:Fe-S cluster assembly protein SufD
MISQDVSFEVMRAGRPRSQEMVIDLITRTLSENLSGLATAKRVDEPRWLSSLRDRARERYEVLDFPTTREEEWRYTNISPILKLDYEPPREIDPTVSSELIESLDFRESAKSRLVFINGIFSAAHSDVTGLSEITIAGSLSDIPAEQMNVLREHLGAHSGFQTDKFTALNTAALADGAFVVIPQDMKVEAIHLLFLSTEARERLIAQPRTLVIAGRGSRATVIESYLSINDPVYFTNAVTEVVVAEGAAIEHYRLQEESDRAFHLATTTIHQARASRYRSCAISIGGALSRHALGVVLDGTGIDTELDGLYVATGNQHIDNHTMLDHQQPQCTSRQLYKGVLDDHARAVFSGKVFVHEGALLTDARQLNRNLLLSPDATVDTKPQLEIYADDVKCAHGATVGQLEDEEIFYLLSRGLSRERARALLTYGFAEDVISKIELPAVHKRLDEVVLQKLHQSLEVS